jgi:co-chaperonin GroES (HSP10)
MAMLPKLIDCNPGFEPMEFNVVVAVAELETKTAGGIIILESKAEADQASSMRGLLVSVAPMAGDAIWPDDDEAPIPGDEVIFAKYGGVLVTGDDGREYRLLKDKDIIAVCNRTGA